MSESPTPRSEFDAMKDWWLDYRIRHSLNNTTARQLLVRDTWLAALAFAQSEKREIPDELFDGYAVHQALGDNSGVSPNNVAAVLDAVVRLIRANRG